VVIAYTIHKIHENVLTLQNLWSTYDKICCLCLHCHRSPWNHRLEAPISMDLVRPLDIVEILNANVIEEINKSYILKYWICSILMFLMCRNVAAWNWALLSTTVSWPDLKCLVSIKTIHTIHGACSERILENQKHWST